MNTSILSSLIRLGTSVFSFCSSVSKNPEDWSEVELFSWFHSGDWRHGWNMIPDESINKLVLATQYYKKKELWKKGFTFLKTTNLEKIDKGRYELKGKELYVIVDEYITKNEQDTNFESHRMYTDIQYLVYGEEKIGITDVKNTTEITPYDNSKDIIFLAAEQNNYRKALSDRFFVFFPGDAHRPCVKVDENINVRKVVLKLKVN